MATNLVPFSDAGLPSTIVNRARPIDVNKDIVFAAPYPNLSIKGKVWTLVKDSERKVITKPDDPDEVVQSLNLGFLRINMHAKTYYKKKYSEEDSEGQMPDCYSYDGVTPSANVAEPQAPKCAVCPHNVWGSRVSEDNTGKGKACSDNARIAVVDPSNIERPLLLRVPPASLRPLKDALKMVKTRQLQYNEVVFRVGFDHEAASPKLTFKPVGILDDASYTKACEMFEDEIVRAIVGADEAVVAPATPSAATEEADELDAAIAAKKAAPPAPPPPPEKPKAEAKPKPAAEKPKAEAKPKPAPAPAPAPVAENDDLLGDIDSLLGNLDD